MLQIYFFKQIIKIKGKSQIKEDMQKCIRSAYTCACPEVNFGQSISAFIRPVTVIVLSTLFYCIKQKLDWQNISC